MRAAWVILRKDLRLRLRDRSVLLFAVVVPLGLTVLFSFILPETEQLRLTGAVVDLDGGAVAHGFVDGALPGLVDAELLALVEVADLDDAQHQVTAGEIDVVWVLPRGLSDAVAGGRPGQLDVLVADGRTLQGEIARGVATAFAAQVDLVGLAVATIATATGQPVEPALVDRTVALAATVTPGVSITSESTGTGAGLDMVSRLAAGMAAFFVFFTVQFGVTGLLEERQQGTMPRLLAAPIRPAAIHVGKILGALVLGLVSMAVLAIASDVILGASWGNPAGVTVLIVALVFAALGVMALVGSFARTAEQAGNFQSIVAVVLGMLGGVFFPVPGDAALLRLANNVSPHGWFLRGLDQLVATGQLRAVLPAVAAMVAFGVVAAGPAVLLQRRAQSW